jgi:multicomponent Na+:H+ antiporter subunit F
MIEISTTLSFVILSAATILALRRVFTGPSVLDRIIGFDAGAICMIGMMALLSIRWKTGLLIEIMMIFSLLGFVGTIAFVSYLNTAIPRQRRSSAAWKEKKRQRKEARK